MQIDFGPGRSTTIQDDLATVQAQAASLGVVLPVVADAASAGVILRHAVKAGTPVPLPKILGPNK